jgi:hypothetical protein
MGTLTPSAMRRFLAMAAATLITALGLAGSAPPASAGGPFERLVAVGAAGEWRAIRLAPKGARSDGSLFAGGQRISRPESGYVRLFPTIGGLPGIPGRYYPAERVLCWSWRQPDRDCWRANATAARLLAPLTGVPRRRREPTVLAELHYQGQRVRPALANLRVALELAFERPGVKATKTPARALRFAARWRGPAAANRPRRFALGPAGVYSGALLYRLERGVWDFADANRKPGPTTSGLTASSPPTPLYGIAGPAPVGLVRLEPRTLRPLPGRRVPLAAHTFGWSFSPDRSTLAIGSDGSGEVRLVDLRRWRVLGDVRVRVERRGSVIATAWAGETRVLAAIVRPGCCGIGDTTVAGIASAPRPHLLWQRRLAGSLQAGHRFRRSLVLVLGPPGRSLGSSRLVVVTPNGRVRSARLAEIRSGSEVSGGSDPGRFLVRAWNPGLAVDPEGARAFVVQAGAPVVEVDLRSLQVRYHGLSEPISLLGRLRDWLEPPAQAKAQEGPNRQALWLGRGLLAVTGTDTHASVDAGGRQQQWDTPAGLKLIDTRRWSIRTLDPHASSATVAAGTLLAFGIRWDSRSQMLTGSGLTGYSLDGERRFHLYDDDPVSLVQPLGARILVGGTAGSRIFKSGALLDPRTGRELGRVRFQVSLLFGDQPFWY